ncbi:chymotrypsin-C [Caerostris darwini]|uniref:Chymotrypsin-C n=1 Tax=Caerostris darwini TaxID=1538125 RepID=A0AAV4WD99_9ARAC|nr:chymotrypsin-C [Caerostris darwini]
MLQTERIIGGSQASQEQSPWAAALYNDDTFTCTASIISTTAILTAAHCVVLNGVQMQPNEFNAIVGNVNRSASGAQQIFFRKITVHPQYNSAQQQNDLAILETTQPIKFSDTVKRICIADSNIGSLLLKKVTAMGWGQTTRENENNVYPETLRYVRQRVVSNFNCMVLYLGKTVPDTLLCASGILSGACSGDSGGPLVYYIGRQPVQVGVASFANAIFGCGTKLGPAGFTRVSSYNDFIMNTATGNVCVV